MRLIVKDSGIGIAPAALKRLFQPFEQAESGTTRRYGGTGLGLAIVKRLLDLMGGDVSVVSEPEQGTTITVTLPLDVPDGANHAIGSGRVRGRVLIVEPDVAAREILATYVAAAGFECEVLADPADGLARLRQRSGYDALLLGLWESDRATQRLLAYVVDDPELGRLRRVVVTDSVPERGRVDGLVTRPIKRAQLIERLEQARSQRSTGRDQTLIVPAEQAPTSTVVPRSCPCPRRRRRPTQTAWCCWRKTTPLIRRWPCSSSTKLGFLGRRRRATDETSGGNASDLEPDRFR